jgi:hypothetical protein
MMRATGVALPKHAMPATSQSGAQRVRLSDDCIGSYVPIAAVMRPHIVGKRFDRDPIVTSSSRDRD